MTHVEALPMAEYHCHRQLVDLSNWLPTETGKMLHLPMTWLPRQLICHRLGLGQYGIHSLCGRRLIVPVDDCNADSLEPCGRCLGSARHQRRPG